MSITRYVNVAAGVILMKEDDQEKMLLIQRSAEDRWPLHWEFPRGKCETNEDIRKCLRREIKEETGLDVEIFKFIKKFQYVADGGERLTTQHNFLCYVKDPNQQVKLSNEHEDFKWVSTKGEVDLLMNSEMKKIVEEVFKTEVVEENVGMDSAAGTGSPSDAMTSINKLNDNVKELMYGIRRTTDDDEDKKGEV